MEYAFNGHANNNSYHQIMDFGDQDNQDPEIYQKYMGLDQDQLTKSTPFCDPLFLGSHQWQGSGASAEEYQSKNYQSRATIGGAGYRSSLRYGRYIREMNSRNGLYSPMDQSGRRGITKSNYTSLPGLGALETPSFKPGNTKSPW